MRDDNAAPEPPSSDEVIETLASIRHEFRTPLNHILGYTELLIDQADEVGRTETAGDLRKIQAAGRRLTDMVDLLLNESPPHRTYAAPGTDPSGAGKGVTHTAMTGARPILESVVLLASQKTVTDTDHATAAPHLPLLVVDDEPNNREVLARLLRQLGYRVLEAKDGAEALATLEETPCDAVFLDVMMPVMNGYETLQAIAADEVLRYTPVIMISALDELQVVAHCIEAGAEDYLPKPFNTTILKARLAATLERKRLRDQEQDLLARLAEAYEKLQEAEQTRETTIQDLVGDLRVALSEVQKT